MNIKLVKNDIITRYVVTSPARYIEMVESPFEVMYNNIKGFLQIRLHADKELSKYDMTIISVRYISNIPSLLVTLYIPQTNKIARVYITSFII